MILETCINKILYVLLTKSHVKQSTPKTFTNLHWLLYPIKVKVMEKIDTSFVKTIEMLHFELPIVV